jgi:hypothetical protein
MESDLVIFLVPSRWLIFINNLTQKCLLPMIKSYMLIMNIALVFKVEIIEPKQAVLKYYFCVFNV